MPGKKVAEISKDCVACGCCVKACPLDAVMVHRGKIAVVDSEKCVGCGKCAKECPACIVSIKQKEGEPDAKEALV
ncbi:MAG: 4Fe-4S binding protein [Oscillospiraceae bacterium]|nr:4Fe-4S binding protein [Oscillospiraceae bacterium]